MKSTLYSIMMVAAIAFTSCNKCKDITCNDKGTCDKGECSCDAGWSGANCETEDKCITNNVTCQNAGTCVNGECDCAADFYGVSCEDKCVFGSYDAGNCDCNLGYEGNTCETESRTKFLGDYAFSSNCNSTPSTASIEIHDDYEEAQYVRVERLASDNDVNGYALVSGNLIWVPKQTVQGNSSWTIESLDTATLSNDKFTITVNRKNSVSNINCTLTYTRL